MAKRVVLISISLFLIFVYLSPSPVKGNLRIRQNTRRAGSYENFEGEETSWFSPLVLSFFGLALSFVLHRKKTPQRVRVLESQNVEQDPIGYIDNPIAPLAYPVTEFVKSALDSTTKTNWKKEEAKTYFRDMVLGRVFEDKCAELYYGQKLFGFVHLYSGQEAISSGFIKSLRASDTVCSTYRDHVHALSKGSSAKKVMAELFGKKDGLCRGQGGSMHMFDKEHGVLGGYAFIGEGIPIATGAAFASKYEKVVMGKKDEDVCIAFFGDGTANIGQFYECLNLAALWKLPIIFVVENNFWAIGMNHFRATANPKIHEKAATFGMPSYFIDGMDINKTTPIAEECIARARRGDGPSFVEAEAYRYRGHSLADPDELRDKREKSFFRGRCPIEKFKKYLIEDAKLVTEEELQQIEDEVDEEVEEAVQFATDSQDPPVTQLLENVFPDYKGFGIGSDGRYRHENPNFFQGVRSFARSKALKEITMPALSSTMKEGKVTEWIRNVGDEVKKGDPIVIVESDKADMEVESFHKGRILGIMTQSGEAAAVGSVIAVMGQNEKDEADFASYAPSVVNPVVNPVVTPVVTPVVNPVVNPVVTPVVTPVVNPVVTPVVNPVVTPVVNPSPVGEPKEVKFGFNPTPVAEKRAKELKIDISKVQGTGNNSRVVENDILRSAGKPEIPPILQPEPSRVTDGRAQFPVKVGPTRELFMFESLREATDEEMARDPRVCVLGEDVGHYGGSYKVTQNLYKKYGDMRVLDTPICENAFLGMGIGASMQGLRPVVEGMNMGFLLLGFNQISNNCGMLHYTSGGQYKTPIVIRGPGGVGKQLGAEHSQRLEAYFQAVPGLQLVACSTPYNAKGLLKAAIRSENPIMFYEHVLLYNEKEEVPSEDYVLPLEKAELVREGKQITILTYSRMRKHTMEAVKVLEQQGYDPEVIDLISLKPIDMGAVAASIRKTHRCLIVEECYFTGGIGASLSRSINDDLFYELDAPIKCLSSQDVPTPYAASLENCTIVLPEDIVKAVQKLCG